MYERVQCAGLQWLTSIGQYYTLKGSDHAGERGGGGGGGSGHQTIGNVTGIRSDPVPVWFFSKSPFRPLLCISRSAVWIV